VTFSADLHQPNYGCSNETLGVSIGYQGMALGHSGNHAGRTTHTEGMVDEIQRSGGSHHSNFVLGRALSGYAERPREVFDGAPRLLFNSGLSDRD
jgi:hypothetical protein